MAHLGNLKRQDKKTYPSGIRHVETMKLTFKTKNVIDNKKPSLQKSCSFHDVQDKNNIEEKIWKVIDDFLKPLTDDLKSLYDLTSKTSPCDDIKQEIYEELLDKIIYNKMLENSYKKLLNDMIKALQEMRIAHIYNMRNLLKIFPRQCLQSSFQQLLKMQHHFQINDVDKIILRLLDDDFLKLRLSKMTYEHVKPLEKEDASVEELFKKMCDDEDMQILMIKLLIGDIKDIQKDNMKNIISMIKNHKFAPPPGLEHDFLSL